MAKKDRAKETAQDLEDRGWEALGFPEPSPGRNAKIAEGYFRQALAIDPDLADPYNGLGNVLFARGRYAEAEAMYRKALEKARAELGSDTPPSYAWWGDISTRPYMRARHNLGLVFWRQKKYQEAIREFEELLRRNPNDNQGARYLIGGLYHLSGNLRQAVSCYAKAGAGKFGHLDPGTEFNHGLALFQTRKFGDAILQFRSSFFLNPYLPRVMLSQSVKPLKIWHSSNLAAPDQALDYEELYSKLWVRRPRALTFLRLVYEDETVQSELGTFLEIYAKLLGEKDFRVRSFLVEEAQRLESWERLKATNPGIVSRVLSRFRGGG